MSLRGSIPLEEVTKPGIYARDGPEGHPRVRGVARKGHRVETSSLRKTWVNLLFSHGCWGRGGATRGHKGRPPPLAYPGTVFAYIFNRASGAASQRSSHFGEFYLLKAGPNAENISGKSRKIIENQMKNTD